jgi:hypothetical protein
MLTSTVAPRSATAAAAVSVSAAATAVTPSIAKIWNDATSDLIGLAQHHQIIFRGRRIASSSSSSSSSSSLVVILLFHCQARAFVAIVVTNLSRCASSGCIGAGASREGRSS